MGFHDIPCPEIPAPRCYEDLCRPIIILKEPLYTPKEMEEIIKNHNDFMSKLKAKEAKGVI